MQINAIIHDLRIKQGLTQEQMANHLGVSTPAVNKWEKGVTYPDITLLPSLARLLDTDLNTLLSFQEDLSDKEISMFSEKIVTEAKEHGFPIAYNMAFEKIREYPTCDNLILQTALTLQGIFSMYPDIRKNDDFKKDDFDAAIEGLYVRVSTSKSPTVCETAKSMLISTYMQRGEYEKAKVMIESLPDRTTVDKKNLEASLLLRLEDYDNSAVLIEQRLLQETALIYTDLMHLMNIAIKKDQPSKASYLADVTKQFTFLFDLWEYNAYVAEFELAMYQRDPSACIMVLEKLLPALLKKLEL